ncbi:MAG TPA: hypothetical protein VFL85_04005 [Candidatus Saccharimonadales bacterium]|nr:hypothetical protein [Candidatus Saccharimonadales bacterium]
MNELILHERTQAAINALLANPQHAVIITGQTGIGKESIARKLAADLLHIAPEKLTDFQFAKIVGEKDEPIKIEDVRTLQHFFSLKTAGGQGVQRVALIVGAERMTPEAQNALLKTLEEPPEDSVIIMTAKDEQAMLATVRSRSQIVTLIAPNKAALQHYFKQAGHSEAEIKRVMLMSGGLPGLMTALLAQESDHPLIRAAEMARDILRHDTFARLALVDTLSKQKELCRDTLFILQQMAQLSLTDTSKNAAAQKQWRCVLTESFAAEQTLASTNATPKLVLTNFMLAL